jgi:Rrf2 family transcriptional regulator, iron-sulfur cluster assembly transcription factor
MLCLSQTTGYAVLALSCLADVGEDRWVLSDSISQCTGIPRAYLSKIMHSLGSSGLIHAKRGYRGGFTLSRPAERISVMDVAMAVEGRAWLPKCLLGLNECSDDRACPTHTFWSEQRTQIEKKLSELSLREVAEYEKKRGSQLLGCSCDGGDEPGPRG